MNTPEKIADISGPVTSSQQPSLQNPIIHTKRHRAEIKHFHQIEYLRHFQFGLKVSQWVR